MAAPKFTLPPPFQSVSLEVYSYPDDEMGLYYLGTPEALVSAGCCTLDMLEPGGRGKPRWDSEGYKFWRTPLSGGRRYRLARFLPLEAALAMPGVVEALADREKKPRPFQRRLPLFEGALSRRYPGVEVKAMLQRQDCGELLQTFVFVGPPAILERHGLATKEWLERERDGRSRREVDEHGSYRYGGLHAQGDGLAHLALHTPVDLLDPERVPKWAEQATKRVVKRLMRVGPRR